MNNFKISHLKYLAYLKILKFKINLFVPKNTIEFIISHYNEDFKYLDYLPTNQKITIYLKKKNIKKKINKNYNIKFIQLDNIGKEGHTYLYHIINNYKKLSKINFFISASFINFKDRLINFTRIYKKVSDLNKKKYKGLYTFDGYFFLKNKKLKILDPNFRIFKHITSQGIKHILIPSKIYPLKKFLKTNFKNKQMDKYILSLNGIIAANKENITSVEKKVYQNIINEFKVVNRDYEIGHYLERLYPSIFRL